MRKFIIKYLPIFFIFVGSLSCTKKKESFYKKAIEANDVWRLPIVEPYQLLTAYCCEGWGFGSFSSFDKAFGINTEVDSINVSLGYIFIHSPSYWKGKYIIVKIDDRSKHFFPERQSFQKFCEINNLSTSLFSPKNVYYGWKMTGQLPWGNEILKKIKFQNISESEMR